MSRPVHFSAFASSIPAQPNALYRERDDRLASGRPVVDLVSGNVTEQGITFPPDLFDDIFREAAQQTRTYRPHPLGHLPAREAISAYYRDHGIDIPAPHILLTPGTSLAYWYLFAVFCDPGDEVLAPRPSYPLFDDLANLARVRMASYRLDESRGWAIDVDSLVGAITARTRAIILISPHNPTGAVASMEEIDAVATVAAERGLPIVADEVFGEFLFDLDRLPRPATSRAPLVVTLNGFSKLLALPGIKLGWMALSGETSAIARALTAFERSSDSLLPVNEIVQAAAPRLLSEGGAFAHRYRKEIAARSKASLDIITRSPRISLVPPRGGFYAALRVNTSWDDETLALHILGTADCLVHPGFFYDLDPTHLVLSLVSAPETGRAALDHVLAAINTAP